METERTEVLIAGGGPCGLMLAIELGRRGVSCILLDEKPGTAFNPQANATQARTMEHFRRVGLAAEIRAQGLPPDHPTDIAYFTRFLTHELARFRLPSSRDATQVIRSLSGDWSAAELPHRVSQKYVEAVLRRHAETFTTVSLRYAWRMASFHDDGDGIAAEAMPLPDGAPRTIRASYLMGADGARSAVRAALGFGWTGETGTSRGFMGGRMCAVYLRARSFDAASPNPPAWMKVTVNAERRALLAAVDGRGEYAFHAQLQPGEDEARVTEADARRFVREAMGRDLKVEVLSHGFWTAGHALVAEGMSRGRVFLGGDAAHLFTPTGGLGYNTAVEDAVNLGWKLHAILRGQAGPALLDSYAAERRPLALRNTGYARAFADSLGLFHPDPALEDDSEAGEASRRAAGEYLADHARREFNIPGVTFGGRYDGSPVIVPDGTAPPPDAANTYVPTACPGGRPPHLWLDDGRSLYDAFGRDWTLLRTRSDAGEAFAQAAARLGADLAVLDVPAARDLYAADLALIRPDGIVAWRGDADADARKVMDRVLGRVTASAPPTPSPRDAIGPADRAPPTGR
ncbi:FAD-dependent oxidoreductase [Roseomonas sp. CCTCC AB2023176]|uniref:FAD-dependent oxidoreductase n=1 Tax=Roseomonas sp. CCTCC AB2023176 TaxID=3342640 RepID=UPI0035D63377